MTVIYDYNWQKTVEYEKLNWRFECGLKFFVTNSETFKFKFWYERKVQSRIWNTLFFFWLFEDEANLKEKEVDLEGRLDAVIADISPRQEKVEYCHELLREQKWKAVSWALLE